MQGMQFNQELKALEERLARNARSITRQDTIAVDVTVLEAMLKSLRDMAGSR